MSEDDKIEAFLRGLLEEQEITFDDPCEVCNIGQVYGGLPIIEKGFLHVCKTCHDNLIPVLKYFYQLKYPKEEATR